MKTFAAVEEASPLYPSYLAYRSLRRVGLLMYLGVVLHAFGFVMLVANLAIDGGGVPIVVPRSLVMICLIKLSLAITFRTAAVAVMEQRRWGAIVGIALGTLSLLVSLVGAVAMLVRIAAGTIQLDHLGTIGPLLINAVLVLFFVQAVEHCLQALRTIEPDADQTEIAAPTPPLHGS